MVASMVLCESCLQEYGEFQLVVLLSSMIALFDPNIVLIRPGPPRFHFPGHQFPQQRSSMQIVLLNIEPSRVHRRVNAEPVQL